MQMQPGQNAPLNGMTPRVGINVPSLPAGFELDMTAFSLNSSGKVLGDEGMVFYGATNSPDGSVRLDTSARTFQFDLTRGPPGIEKIAVCLTLEKGGQGQPFSNLSALSVEVQHGGEALSFAPQVAGMTEKALILAEIYLRNGAWKVRALAQGFNGGLAPLAKNYGVDVEELSTPASAAAPSSSAAQRTPPANSRVSLSKITLEKRKPVDLSKREGSAGYGKIICNLNWNQGGSGGNFLGGLFGGRGGIDLDLACFFEHADGYRGVIQALGNSFGSYKGDSLCQLMGDDRSGSSAQGEFLNINGDQWSKFKRVLVYAFIYEGVPSWDKAAAKVTITMPGQPDLEAIIDHHENKAVCAIAMLQNNGGNIKVTKLVEFFGDQSEMDRAYGFGFRWRAGQK
jgi:tellurite resistance protein TerA